MKISHISEPRILIYIQYEQYAYNESKTKHLYSHLVPIREPPSHKIIVNRSRIYDNQQ